jgi:hypothetical protein
MVRYEDLRSDPQTHVRELFDWLGLQASAGELSALIEKHEFEKLPDEARGRQSFYRAASPGLWRENLSAEEQAAVQEALGPKLRELGYEVSA